MKSGKCSIFCLVFRKNPLAFLFAYAITTLGEKYRMSEDSLESLIKFLRVIALLSLDRNYKLEVKVTV
jgi:hypothetical protein